MKRSLGRGLVVGLAASMALAACAGGGAPGGSGQAPGNGGMMGSAGMMGRGGMMGGMMSGPADTAAAPRTQVAAGTAAGCPETSQALVDAGRKIFTGAGNCYSCHGSDARGTALAPDLTDSTWLDGDGSYGSIASVIRTGVARPKQHPAPMPPMGGAQLSATQVCAVAAYVYSLGQQTP